MVFRASPKDRVTTKLQTETSKLAPVNCERHAHVLEYISKNIGRKITIDELAAQINVSKYHFARRFKHAEGIAPMAYVARLRVEEARTKLAQGHAIASVAVACGFSSQSHLSRAIKKATGMTPAQYQRAVFSPPR